MAIVQTMAKYLSAPAISILLCFSWCLKTLLAQRALLTLQVRALFKLTFWIFPLITYFRYHVTEYCAVIGTHSTVQVRPRGDKLLYRKFQVACPKTQYWISNWPITFGKTAQFAKCDWSIHISVLRHVHVDNQLEIYGMAKSQTVSLGAE